MTKTLEVLREEIDKLDEELLKILAKRLEIVTKIGKLKDIHQVEILDESRKKELLTSLLAKAKQLNLAEEFITKLFTAIHDQAVELQKKV